MANLLSTSIAGQLTVNSGRLLLQTGGVNTYGIVSGYNNNNHFITMRGSVSGSTSSPTFGGAHQMTFVEYAEAGDSTGWYFKSSSSGTYEEIARITRSGINWSGNNVIHSGGGQTINGITYFSNGESLNLYGIRGRFTNEYIHLYEKVGIGHPGGWGQGEANTPTQGLSIYGGINIAYARDNGATINTYTRINKNWGGGDYSAEAFTIRGTYPSITLRSTQHNSKWLIHHASALQFYYGGTVDDNNWANKFEIPTDGNIWMAWANANISTLLDAKQNASTAITTSNIGSQSVNYANSAGSASSVTWANVSGKPSLDYQQEYTFTAPASTDGSGYSWVRVSMGGFNAGGDFVRFSINRAIYWNDSNPYGGPSMDVVAYNREWHGGQEGAVITYAEHGSVPGSGWVTNAGPRDLAGSGYWFYMRIWGGVDYVMRVYRGSGPIGTSWQSTSDPGSVFALRVGVNNIGSTHTGFNTTGPIYGSTLYNGTNAVIHAGNIASQSVSYAVTSGTSSATTQTNFAELFIENVAVATKEFVTSQGYLTSLPSHNHDDRYYTESESDGRYLRSDIYNTANAGLQVFRNIGTIDGSWPSSDHTLGLENNDAGTIVVNFHRAGYTSHNLWYNGSQFRFDQVVTSTADFRAPIFYDSNNTNYYGDFDATSRFSRLLVQQAGVNSTAGPALRVSKGWDNGTPDIIYDTVVIESNDVTTIRMKEADGGTAGWSTGDGNTSFTSNVPMRFYTGGNESSYIYSGQGGTLAMYISNDQKVGIGTSDFSYATGDNTPVVGSGHTTNKLYVNGSIQLLSNDDAIVIGRGAATFLKDEELGFGWGGGWYMTESSYIRSRGSKSLHMNYGSVDYVGSLYLEGSGVGAHLQPNAGSLGSLQVTGSKNGWHGIRFTGSDVNLMANANEVGFHNNAVGWQFLWSAGTAYVYKGGTGGGTQATVLDTANAFYAWNMNQYVRTSDSPTFQSLFLPQNPVGSTYGNGVSATPPNRIEQRVGDNDGWRIYGEAGATNEVRMVFELIDDIETAYSDQWVFRNKLTYGAYTARNEFQISGNGDAQARGSMRAPIFYSSVDTNYFWEPNVSSAHRFRTANGYVDIGPMNGSWCHFQTDRANFYFGSTIYADASGFATYGGSTSMTKTDINSPIFLVPNHSDNTKGYRIYNTSNSSVSAMFVNSSNQLVIAAGAVDQVNLNKKVLVNGVALGVNVAPSATAGRIDASNDIVAYSSSDERLKYNIAPIENALDKVKSLTGVEFDWKPEYKHAHGYEGHDTGVIAQQVEAVMPSAVRTNDTGFLAVRYEKLIGLLIEANKELAARVEELEKKLN